ncbi:hypothetical protein Bhyg_14799 [Pseudolycoriella hygida]|uniref:Uncharacterized protein n=1 Tax=Pseudolycoriella hygida TaxID=35572 RepID=A0A9Q0MQS9_9DIPT|nr:hypothetical protein Bhyg_14799 [Pseudolycoriella hygida]
MAIGMVVIVLVVVGLVFYFSQRNFKKRCNIHRRRWLESDINIGNHDGQIYDTSVSLEECQSQPIDLYQDDFPPSYETVVQQSRNSLKRNDHSSENNFDELERDSPKCQSNCCEEFPALLHASQPINHSISTISGEHSSLIGREDLASSSSHEVERTIRRNYSKDESKANIRRMCDTQIESALEMQTEERLEIVPTKTAECQNEIASLDASGLPSYDTALKIQACGNM